MNKIRIFLVDDHKIVRDGIRAMFIGVPDIDIVGEASSGPEVLSLVSNSLFEWPDLFIVDLAMPEMGGSELIIELIKRHEGTSALVLTANSDEESVLNAIKAGAMGFLTKDTSQTELLQAIHAICGGEEYYGSNISQLVYNCYMRSLRDKGDKTGKQSISLSEREIQVLTLFSEGNSYKEIADKLHISPRTVETHKINILDKLQLKTTVDLVKYAIKSGLIEL